jgi:hypothetical protein
MAVADQQLITRAQAVVLFAGDTLIVGSDQDSIQRVILQGNLTAANITQPSRYPTNTFKLKAYAPGAYDLTLLLDLASDYQVTVYVQSPEQLTATNGTYYFSSGPSELDIKATFIPHLNTSTADAYTAPPWNSLVSWVTKFGEAFPLWVKLLYLALGIQFFTVGGLWIRRETRKRDGGPQSLDSGNKAFLWLDITYQFLLASLIALILIMGGELILLFTLKFMFLISLDLLSLWDVFVVGFALGAVILTYLIRFTCEKILDLKPLENE